MTSAGGQRTLETVNDIVEFVEHGVELLRVGEEAHLVVHALLAEHVEHLHGGAFVANERHIGSDNLLHALLQSLHCGTVHARMVVLKGAEIALADRVRHHQAFFREQVLGGLMENHDQRASVGAATRYGGAVDKFHMLRAIQRIGEMLIAVIDHYADRANFYAIFNALIHMLQSFATFYINIFTDIGAVNSQFVVHE